MTARTAARLAWSLCAGCVVGGGGVVVLQLLNGTSDLGWAPLPALLAFAVVGALVAARQPQNSVGWLLLAVAVCMTVRLVGESYAIYALITAPGSLPGGLYGAWVQWSWFGVVAILAGFLPLYFPTGRLLSPRWRPVLWLGIAFLSSAVVSNALQPGPTEWLAGVRPLQPTSLQRGQDHPGVLGPPARADRPGHPRHRAVGGRGPNDGADPGLALASTFPTRLPGHSYQCATADSLGLLSTTAGLYL
jgi:hypothetical protein